MSGPDFDDAHEGVVAPLGPLTRFVLSKISTKDELDGARDALGPGEYEIDVSLRIRGKLVVGHPFEQRVTGDIPVLLLLAIAMRKSGIQRDNIKNAVIEMMKEIAAHRNKPWEENDFARDLEGALDEARKAMLALPKRTVRGQTHAVLEVEVFSDCDGPGQDGDR